MAYILEVTGSRLRFRPIHEDDAALVTTWRNTDQARAAFFAKDVVTPDTHELFVKHRKPHDLVWMVEQIIKIQPMPYLSILSTSVVHTESQRPHKVKVNPPIPIGMTSLTVDPKYHTAEYGRTIVDQQYQGQGLAKELEYFTLYLAFDWLRLRSLWLDAYTANEPVINLHHKTGWQDKGVDIQGHIHPGGKVLHMTYDAADWPENRQAFVDQFGVTLP